MYNASVHASQPNAELNGTSTQRRRRERTERSSIGPVELPEDVTVGVQSVPDALVQRDFARRLQVMKKGSLETEANLHPRIVVGTGFATRWRKRRHRARHST